MKNIVFVRRPGGYKEDDSWCCSSQAEAERLQKWLRHLKVGRVEVMSLEAHEKLPNRQPELE